MNTDETVELEDLDALLFPTILNMLYHSRGMITVLPSRDSPTGFRERLTRYVTRRRFDTRVRIVDYVGEAERAPYVVHLNVKGSRPDSGRTAKDTAREVAKMEAAEKAIQGRRRKAYLELSAFEIMDTLVGSQTTSGMALYGIKRARAVGNLVIGLLGPGVGAADAIRRMADTEFRLQRDEVGLTIRGLRPGFPAHVVTFDESAGPPHVAFVPRPL